MPPEFCNKLATEIMNNRQDEQIAFYCPMRHTAERNGGCTRKAKRGSEKNPKREIVAKNEVPEAIHGTGKLQSSSAGQRANRT